MINPTIKKHSVAPHVEIEISRDFEHIPNNVCTAVDKIWDAGLQEAKSSLYDGTLYSVTKMTPARITVQKTRYKHFYAQLQDPNLFEALKVRPLACNGVLRSHNGLVFARRSKSVMLDQQCWEFAPSGTFDDDCKSSDTTLDVGALFRIECLEELGIPGHALKIGTVLGAFEHLHTRAFDLILEAKTPLRKADIERAFRARKTKEYSDLAVVHDEEIEGFVKQHRTQFVSTTLAILDVLTASK